jgi:hypothetical protein
MDGMNTYTIPPRNIDNTYSMIQQIWLRDYIKSVNAHNDETYTEFNNEEYEVDVDTEQDYKVMIASTKPYVPDLSLEHTIEDTLNALDDKELDNDELREKLLRIKKSMEIKKHANNITNFAYDIVLYLDIIMYPEIHGYTHEYADVFGMVDNINIDTNIPFTLVYKRTECTPQKILQKLNTLMANVHKPQFGKFIINEVFETKQNALQKILCEEMSITLIVTNVDTKKNYKCMITTNNYIHTIVPVKLIDIRGYAAASFNVYDMIRSLEEAPATYAVKIRAYARYVRTLLDTVRAFDMYKGLRVVDFGSFKYPKYSIETEEPCYITCHDAPYIKIHTKCGHHISIHAFIGMITKGKLHDSEALRCPQCKADLIPDFADIFQDEEHKKRYYSRNVYRNIGNRDISKYEFTNDFSSNMSNVYDIDMSSSNSPAQTSNFYPSPIGYVPMYGFQPGLRNAIPSLGNTEPIGYPTMGNTEPFVGYPSTMTFNSEVQDRPGGINNGAHVVQTYDRAFGLSPFAVDGGNTVNLQNNDFGIGNITYEYVQNTGNDDDDNDDDDDNGESSSGSSSD